MEIFYISTVQYSSYKAHVATEQLKCDYAMKMQYILFFIFTSIDICNSVFLTLDNM